MAKRFAIGLVARCQKGLTGLILSVRKVSPGPKYPPKVLYKGICLDPGRVGQEWQSFKPEVIGTIDQWAVSRSEELKHEKFARTMSGLMCESCNYPTLRNLK